MAVVFIPGLMRDLTRGAERVTVAGATVRQVIMNLEAAYPGMRERLITPAGELRPGLAVAVDGEEALEGLAATVAPESELFFLPAIAGG